MSLSLLPRQDAGSQSLVQRKRVPLWPVPVSLRPHMKRQSLEQFVRSVCQVTVNNIRNSAIKIDLSVFTDSASLILAPALIRVVVATMVADAIAFSFYERASGRLAININFTRDFGLCIEVSDDGWGFDTMRPEWSHDLQDLSAFGTVTMTRWGYSGDGMVARLVVDPAYLRNAPDRTVYITPGLEAYRPYLLPLLRDEASGSGYPDDTCLVAHA